MNSYDETTHEPKDPNAVPWKVLCTKSDAEILTYFRTVKGQNERYAQNSLRFMRQRYGHGSGTPASQPSPAPAPYVPPTPVETPPAPFTIPTPAGASDGLVPLAQMLAPHLAPLIAGDIHASAQARIEAAVREMHARLAKTATTTIEIARDDEPPRVLEGLHHTAAPKVLKLARKLNVMLVGPAGCGKTVIADTCGAAFQKRVVAVSCSAGMSEAQLLGRLLPLGDNGAFRYVESPFIKAFREGAVILLDEIDAADANLLLVLNALIGNGYADIEARAASGLDVRVTRHPETVILAAANTWGAGADTQYMGRGALDASTLDRFYRLSIDYDHALESKLGREDVVARVHHIRERVRTAKLKRVVSTRMILRVSAAMQAGLSIDEAFADELAPWSNDERAKVA